MVVYNRCYALELCEISLDWVYENMEKNSILSNHIEFILQLSLRFENIIDQNFVHRDIKSGNFLLSKSSNGLEPIAKMADFGCAKTAVGWKYDLRDQRGTALY